VEIPPSAIVKGLPREADFKVLDELAFAIVQKHKQLDLS